MRHAAWRPIRAARRMPYDIRPHVARMCIRKMADSGDGVNSTSSGKEARGTIADGPVTDPASSMKVN